MPLLQVLVARLSTHSELQCIELAQLQKFLSLTSRLLPEILSCMRAPDRQNVDLFTPLPDHIVNFLSAVLDLDANIVVLCWTAFGDFVTEDTEHLLADDDILATTGALYGLGMYSESPFN